MNALLGQPVEQLFAYIGYPNAETNVAGYRLLIYNNSQSVTVPVTQTAYHQGTVSTYGSYGPTTSTYGGTTTYQSTQTYNYQCELRVEIDDNNVIRGWNYYGNLGGCSRYANVGKAAKARAAGARPAEYATSTGDQMRNSWINDPAQFAKFIAPASEARERCNYSCSKEIEACQSYSTLAGAIRCVELIDP